MKRHANSVLHEKGLAEGKLVVSNNLQRKVRQVSSNRVGLTNIAKKYKLLKQGNIEVKEDGNEFLVIIPLIKMPQH